MGFSDSALPLLGSHLLGLLSCCRLQGKMQDANVPFSLKHSKISNGEPGTEGVCCSLGTPDSKQEVWKLRTSQQFYKSNAAEVRFWEEQFRFEPAQAWHIFPHQTVSSFHGTSKSLCRVFLGFGFFPPSNSITITWETKIHNSIPQASVLRPECPMWRDIFWQSRSSSGEGLQIQYYSFTYPTKLPWVRDWEGKKKTL